jgi:pimeloyl-ACP methyl ester carboxylesterase
MPTQSLPEHFKQYFDLNIDARTVLPIAENSFWVTLNSPTHAHSGSLEGKLHLPTVRATKLIIFEPGFPGGACTDFERLHLKGLLAAGYAIFAARHRGTIINGPHSNYYIDCPERQEKAVAENQKVLGNGQASMGDWLSEPLIALDALGGAFEELIVVGHSFGGLAIMYSAAQLFKYQYPHYDKVKKLVHLAGVGARLRGPHDRTIARWSEFIQADWAINRIEIGDVAQNIEHIRKAHETLHQLAASIPPAVDLICLTAYGDSVDAVDELIPPQEALDIIVSVGHGTLIVDTTQRANPAAGEMAHELLSLKTESVLKFVDPAWKPAKQLLRLDAQGIS